MEKWELEKTKWLLEHGARLPKPIQLRELPDSLRFEFEKYSIGN